MTGPRVARHFDRFNRSGWKMEGQESLRRLIDRNGELVGGPDLARDMGATDA